MITITTSMKVSGTFNPKMVGNQDNIDGSYSGTPTHNTKVVSHTFENGIGIITLDADVTRVEGCCFVSIQSLEDVSFPDTVTFVESYALNNCLNVEKFIYPKGVTHVRWPVYAKKVIFPETVTTFGIPVEEVATDSSTLYQLFSNYTTIEEIYFLADEINFYGKNSNYFYIANNCSNLKTIVFAGTKMPKFYYPTYINNGLKVWYENKHPGNCINAINNSAKIFVDPQLAVLYKNLNTSEYPSEYSSYNYIQLISNTYKQNVIPLGCIQYSSRKQIAFDCGDNLLMETFHDGNGKISTFTPCNIPDNAFKNSTAKDIKLVGSFVVGDSAFENCKGINGQLDLSSFVSIGDSSFKGCTNITSIKIESDTILQIGQDAFDDTNDCPIYVYYDQINDYISSPNWSKYESRIMPIVQGLGFDYIDVSTDDVYIEILDSEQHVVATSEQLDIELPIGQTYYIKPTLTQNSTIILDQYTALRDNINEYGKFTVTKSDHFIGVYLNDLIKRKATNIFSIYDSNSPSSIGSIFTAIIINLDGLHEQYSYLEDYLYTDEQLEYFNQQSRNYASANGYDKYIHASKSGYQTSYNIYRTVDDEFLEYNTASGLTLAVREEFENNTHSVAAVYSELITGIANPDELWLLAD